MLTWPAWRVWANFSHPERHTHNTLNPIATESKGETKCLPPLIDPTSGLTVFGYLALNFLTLNQDDLSLTGEHPNHLLDLFLRLQLEGD